MKTVYASPGDIDSVPWEDGCRTCQHLHDDPQPGLATWVTFVGDHFERGHRVSLRMPRD